MYRAGFDDRDILLLQHEVRLKDVESEKKLQELEVERGKVRVVSWMLSGLDLHSL